MLVVHRMAFSANHPECVEYKLHRRAMIAMATRNELEVRHVIVLERRRRDLLTMRFIDLIRYPKRCLLLFIHRLKKLIQLLLLDDIIQLN